MTSSLYSNMEETRRSVCLREVTPEDIRLLYQWANDPVVRQNSFHTEDISWETHEAWFDRMMHNERIRQYIYEVGEEPVGQIRLSLEPSGTEAEISYSIAAEYRGRGHGRRMLSLLEETVCRDLPSVRILTARVKENNEASSRAFLHAGYEKKCVVYEREIMAPG